MLLTNIAVAEQIAVNFPEQALLRRHDNPLERRLVCDLLPPISNVLTYETERVPGARRRFRM